MSHRNIGVRRRHRSSHSFEPIRYGDHYIGSKVVKHRGELDDSQSGRLGGRHQISAFENHVNAFRYLETILLDDLHGLSVSIEQRRCRDHKLQLEITMALNRAQRGHYPRIAWTGGYNNTDFSWREAHAMSSCFNISSLKTGRHSWRPIRSSSFEAGIPVPGFFAVRCSRFRIVPDARSVLATTLLLNIRRISESSAATESLSTGLANIFSIARTPVTSCARAVPVSETGTSGPNISRLNVACTSITEAPSVAAASPA